MATLATETFTGTNGSAWPAQWIAGQTGTGSSATIQGNLGELSSGTQGGYSSDSRISRILNITAPTDVEISGTWKPDANEPYSSVYVRADTGGDAQTGYWLNLNKSGTIGLDRIISYTGTQIGSFSFTASSNTTYGFRLRAVGTAIKARVWSGSEPSTWDIEVTDSGVTGSGAVGVTVFCGNATVNHKVWLDDIVVTDGATGQSVTITNTFGISTGATVTPAGGGSLATESFTGTDGSAWPAQWVAGQTSSGSSATIQSNRGQMASGAQGNYSGASGISRRLNITPPVDCDISGTWRPGSLEPYAVVSVRGDNALDGETGYSLLLNKSGTLKVDRSVNWASTAIGTFNFAASSDTDYGFRLRAVGDRIQARVWSGSEPTTWQVDVTDSGVTGAGAVGIRVFAGAAAVNHIMSFDNIVVTNGTSGSAAVINSTVTIVPNAQRTAVCQSTIGSTFGLYALAYKASELKTGDATVTTALNILATCTVFPKLFTALRVYIQFSEGVWTEVTDKLVGGASISHGRATPFDDVAPSVLSLTLANVDGELMPDNPDSPYYPNFTEDKPIQCIVERGPQSWVRFRGWIKSIQPEFPASSAHESVVRVSAVDALGLAAAKQLRSSWIEGASRRARELGASYDAFIIRGNGSAATYFDNVSTAWDAYATMSVLAWNTADGPLSFGNAEGLSVEGSVAFTPSTIKSGSIIEMNYPSTLRLLQFWVRIPDEDQVVSGTGGVNLRDLLLLRATYTGGASYVLRLKWTSDTQYDLVWYDNTETALGTLAQGVATGRWVRVTLRVSGSVLTTTDCTYDGGGTAGGGSVNIAVDLRSISWLIFGGFGSNVIKAEIAGVIASDNWGVAVPAAEGQAGAVVGTVAERLDALAWAMPGGLAPAVGASLSHELATGIWHDRSALAVAQEIARTVGGVIYVQPAGTWARFYAPDVTYPAAPLATLNAEEDLIGQPRLSRAAEDRPTRVTVQFPGGESTVVDRSRELTTSVGDGVYLSPQVRNATVATVAPNSADAIDLATTLLARSAPGMRISAMTIDLETSAASHDLVPTLFNQSRPDGGLYPTQRLRVLVPASHFGVAAKDVFVEGWTEDYNAQGGAVIHLDLSPAGDVEAGPRAVEQKIPLRFGLYANAVIGTNPNPPAGSLAVSMFGTPASGLRWHSGSWTGWSLQKANGWGPWRGRTSDCVTNYPSYQTWAEMDDSGWVHDVHGAFPGFYNYGLAMLPTNRYGQWDDVLSGAYDSIFLEIANGIKNAGHANSAIRVGLEMNGNWFAWSATYAQRESYKSAFRRIVDLFRSVSTSFKFGYGWSAGPFPQGTPGGTTPSQAFDLFNPGDAYWDFLDIDHYDWDEIQADNDTEWVQALRPSGGVGIGHALDWVRTKSGKGLAIAEWGCATKAFSVPGGDNPFFIRKMWDFFNSCTDVLVYEAYFNEPYANVTNSLWNLYGDPLQCPNAGTEYRRLWGTASQPPPPPVPSTTYPAKEIAVYKMMWSVNGPRLADISPAVNVVRLAFAQGQPPALVGWGNQGQASFLADMAVMRARGVKFVISVGGSGGAVSTSDRATFLAGIANIRSAMGGVLDGLDWDIEASALNQSDVVYISTQLKSIYGSNFAITFVPNGGNVSTYLPAAVACHQAGALDSYGQQFYDAVVSVDAAAGRIQEAINAGIPVSKMSVGMMIGTSSIYWTNAVCRANMITLRSRFPGLQRAYLWEAARAGTAQWATDMASVIGT
jgi:hypothetical protein